jgi:4-hydroxybenzoate polyprenyltransferase
MLRTFLILGRVSNLPTVWSNCLAGWWLGGKGPVEKLPFLFVGATFLYVGGMFLNDAFDVEFDRQHRKERPIPSGAMQLRTVWLWGSTCLIIGVASLFCPGVVPGLLGLALAGCIVLYDAIHKKTDFSPLLMTACRLLLYLVAASSAIAGITTGAVYCGLALAVYVVGISYLARRESLPGPARYWPMFLLAAPICLALITKVQTQPEAALLLSAVLGLWIVRSLRYTLDKTVRNIGQTISGLLAGIVFVDWLAVATAGAPRQFGTIFIVLFLSALLLQKIAPAT